MYLPNKCKHRALHHTHAIMPDAKEAAAIRRHQLKCEATMWICLYWLLMTTLQMYSLSTPQREEVHATARFLIAGASVIMPLGILVLWVCM